MPPVLTITAHFDGKVFIPDHPVDLKPGQRLLLHIQSTQNSEPTQIHAGSAKGEVTISPDFDVPLDDFRVYRE
jgi:Protein of unknown function (DUF2281)